MTIELENVPAISELGTKAIELWRSSDRDGTKGNALAIAALYQAWHTTGFVARVLDKKTGATIEESPFFLEDYIEDKGTTKADGKRDMKLVSARLSAISKRVFNVEEPDQTLKVRILKALKVVSHIASLGHNEDDVQLSKRNELMVPYTVMHAPPSAEAGTNEQKQYEMMKDQLLALDGKNGNTIASLERKAQPAKRTPQTQQAPVDPVTTLTTSIKFVSAMVDKMIGDEENGSDFAPNEELRKLMFELQQKVASYFDADPMDEKKVARKKAS